MRVIHQIVLCLQKVFPEVPNQKLILCKTVFTTMKMQQLKTVSNKTHFGTDHSENYLYKVLSKNGTFANGKEN